MKKLKVIPKPKRKDYEKEDFWTDWMNANRESRGETSKLVKFDKMGYIKHLEKYAAYLEQLIIKLES